MERLYYFAKEEKKGSLLGTAAKVGLGLAATGAAAYGAYKLSPQFKNFVDNNKLIQKGAKSVEGWLEKGKNAAHKYTELGKIEKAQKDIGESFKSINEKIVKDDKLGLAGGPVQRFITENKEKAMNNLNKSLTKNSFLKDYNSYGNPTNNKFMSLMEKVQNSSPNNKLSFYTDKVNSQNATIDFYGGNSMFSPFKKG